MEIFTLASLTISCSSDDNSNPTPPEVVDPKPETKASLELRSDKDILFVGEEVKFTVYEEGITITDAKINQADGSALESNPWIPQTKGIYKFTAQKENCEDSNEIAITVDERASIDGKGVFTFKDVEYPIGKIELSFAGNRTDKEVSYSKWVLASLNEDDTFTSLCLFETPTTLDDNNEQKYILPTVDNTTGTMLIVGQYDAATDNVTTEGLAVMGIECKINLEKQLSREAFDATIEITCTNISESTFTLNYKGGISYSNDR
ncbi:hypothetical protein VSO92_08645 [Myroides pelagicus]|uniref:hypothetical protein n=1 Tax=Myroides pelagicus TaxID=270914 RepID=UPI002DB712A6|nr:hypothetical protein [Myroides pelagicus]MEC4114175.1 hypothetical protein [Myroides pelagicus]